MDLQLRPTGPEWRAPYRLTYYAAEDGDQDSRSNLVGWGVTVEEAIRNLCTDPRSFVFDDLSGYLTGVLDPRPAVIPFRAMSPNDVELPLEAGTKRSELLCAVSDPHNLFALVQWWERGDQIKFRAEAMAPESELVARYEADLELYHATNMVRITRPQRPVARIFEFCVPKALVTADVRFFYRTPEAFYFFRENNPYTSIDSYDFDIPIEGVTLLL